MKKVTERVYQLGSIYGAGVLGANVFLVTGKSLALVDTGYRGRAGWIEKDILNLGFKHSEVKNIIITHHHPDHIGSLARIKETTGARVIARREDARYIDGELPQPGPFYPPWLRKLLYPLHNLWTTTPAKVDVELGDEQVLPGLEGMQFIPAPGHTPGSMYIYMPDERLVITGDVLTNTFGLSLPSKAYTADLAGEIRAVRRMARLDFDRMCFGHGRPIMENARQALEKFIDKMRRKYPGDEVIDA